VHDEHELHGEAHVLQAGAYEAQLEQLEQLEQLGA
jgi:hypothetical protein